MNLQRIQEKKGISPIIATLLLILIAIAAGVIVYAYVVGFIGSESPSVPTVGTDQLSVNAVSYTKAATTITVYVQNVGTNSLNVTSLYIYFGNGTLSQEVAPASGNVIKSGATGTVISGTITALVAGNIYYMRVTTQTGSSATSSNFKT